MTDPAVEACARVARTTATGGIYPGSPYAAARAALAPIRGVIERLDYQQENFRGDSLDYHDLAQAAIEDIRELVYTTEELNDES